MAEGLISEISKISFLFNSLKQVYEESPTLRLEREKENLELEDDILEKIRGRQEEINKELQKVSSGISIGGILTNKEIEIREKNCKKEEAIKSAEKTKKIENAYLKEKAKILEEKLKEAGKDKIGILAAIKLHEIFKKGTSADSSKAKETL
jgi:hypothetical protein